MPDRAYSPVYPDPSNCVCDGLPQDELARRPATKLELACRVAQACGRALAGRPRSSTAPPASAGWGGTPVIQSCPFFNLASTFSHHSQSSSSPRMATEIHACLFLLLLPSRKKGIAARLWVSPNPIQSNPIQSRAYPSTQLQLLKLNRSIHLVIDALLTPPRGPYLQDHACRR